MALNSRENLALRIAELGEGALKDLLTDMNDSSWQWSRNREDSSSRNRKIVVGGQVVDSSQATASASGGNQGSGSQSPGGSSTSLDQVQSDWKESNNSSKAFIKNKPTLGSISSYDFQGEEGDVYFDGKIFITKKGSSGTNEVRRTAELSHCYSLDILDYSKIMIQAFFAPVDTNIKNLRICYTGMNDGIVRISIWSSSEDAIQYTQSTPTFRLLHSRTIQSYRSVWLPSIPQNFDFTIPKGWFAIGVDAVGSSGTAKVAAYQPPSLMSPASDYPSPSQEILLSSGQDLPDNFVPSIANNASQLVWVEFETSPA